jgi:D-lactate dehydrogenase
MMVMRVLFTDLIFEDRERIRLDGCTFKLHGQTKSERELIELSRDVDVVCMRDQFVKVTREILDKLPRLKMIATRSTGYDHIDLKAASEKRIVVCNVPDYGTHVVAEHAFGLLLAVARNIVKGANRYSQERIFSDKGLVGVELSGKTLGILGTGKIGAHAARIAQGFGMQTIAYDIVKNLELEKGCSTRYLQLEEVLEEADFVTIHLPLNDRTKGLICERTLQLVKEGSILINTARGAIVVTEDLIKAVRQGRLAGAALDVLEDERQRYHNFTGLNVIVTPHLGWYTKEVISRILDNTLDNIRAFMESTPKNRVN